MLLNENDKLVFIGDSVTDAGRAQPVGEGLFNAQGNSYVQLVASILDNDYPERQIRVVNMGTSGNNVRDLVARWDRDVIQQKPDWLSIMIGINDVWRQYDCPKQHEIHVYLSEYEKTLEELVVKTLPMLKGLVLMTPYYIESNPDDAMRATMDKYGAVVKAISEKYNTKFVDTQGEFNRLLQYMHSATIAWDRVHPNQIGHMMLAKAFLKAVEG